MSEELEDCSRCGRAIARHETAFVLEGGVVCRQCKDNFHPVCPYCHKDLPGKPAPYARCPHCHGTILIRTRQDIYDSTLLTRDQADTFDTIEASLQFLAPFGIVPRDYIAMQRRLTEEKEGQAPHPDEIIWQLFHEAAQRLGGDPRLPELYHLQARFVHTQGKNHMPIHQKWARTLLRQLQRDGHTHVRLDGQPEACIASRRFHGQIIPLEQAMTELPLPCRDCNHRIVTDRLRFKRERFKQTLNNKPFCECQYTPVTVSSDGSAQAAANTTAQSDAMPEPSAFDGLDI